MSRPRWWLPALLAALLALALLPVQGLLLDDWTQLHALQRGSWALFTFAEGDPATNDAAVAAGHLPWFSHPELKLAFFRPLSSALHALDHALFGLGTLGRGLHSAAWYVALCVAVTALYRRALPDRLAWPAALLFAIAGPHAQAVAWFPARNALIAGTFGALAVLAHLHGRVARFVGSPLLLLLALSAGEAGLGAAGLILAHVLLRERGSERLFSLLPATLVSLGWVGLYVALGYGAAHSGAYLDPLHEPVAFLAAAPGRLAFAVSVLLVGVSSELWYLLPGQHLALAVAGALVSLPFAVWLGFTLHHLDAETRGPLLWLGLGALFAVVPVLAGLLGSRSFVVPGIGAIPVVVCLLVDPWRGGNLRGLRIAGAVLLALGHVGFGLSMWVQVPWALQAQRAETRAAIGQLREVPDDETVVLLSAPSADVATYGAAHLAVLGEAGPRLIPLAVGPAEATLKADGDAVVVTYDEVGWSAGSFHRLYGRPTAWEVGTLRAVEGLSVEVVERSAGRLRLRVAVEGPVRWWRWEGGRFEEAG